MGLNQSLCSPEQNQYQWCTYEAVDNFTITIEITYLIALLIYAIIIAHQFFWLLKYRCSEQYRYLFGDVFVQIFACIFVWLAGSIFRTGLSVFIYYQYMESTFTTRQMIERAVNDGLVIWASVYTFFDFLCSFFINFMMIIIPYHWIKTLLLNISEHKLQNLQLRKKIKKFFTVISIVRIHYHYIRLLYLLLLFLEPIFLFYTKFGGCSWPFFNYIYVISQSSLILLFYIFCAYTASFLQRQNLVRIKEGDFKRIKIEYFLLLTVLMFRITLNSIFRLSSLYEYTPTQNCSDPIYRNKVQASIFLSLHHLFMHLLPIGVITYIYRPNIKQRQQENALMENLDAASNESLKTVENSESYQYLEKQFFRSSLVDRRILKITSGNQEEDEDQ